MTHELNASGLPVGARVERPPAGSLELDSLLVGEPGGLRAVAVARALDGGAGLEGGAGLDFDAVCAELFAATHGSPEHEALWTYLPYGPFESAAGLRAWFEAAARWPNARAFLLLDGDVPLGSTSFANIEVEHQSVEIAHVWYRSDRQRQGLNRRFASALVEAAVARGYRRIEWKCDALNAASQRAAKGLGFEFEGVFRQHRIVRGRNRDTAWFSLVR